MAQPSVAAFFNTRKRAIIDGDTSSLKNRRLVDIEPSKNQDITSIDLNIAKATTTVIQQDDEIKQIKAASTGVGMRTRSGRVVKRIGKQQSEIISKKSSKLQEIQTTLVPFIKKGPLTPKKEIKKSTTIKSPTKISNQPLKEAQKIQNLNEVTPSTNISKVNSKSSNSEHSLRTPTKQIIKGSPVKHGELKRLVRKELNFDEVKTKISRSAKLQELKASLERIKELEKTRQAQEEHNRRLREGLSEKKAQQTTKPVVQLKEFDTIEVEVLTSPVKIFKTPTKLPPATPDKNELMSPRHTQVSKRVLFSPAKHGSPSKLVVPPAYQRFMSLVESGSKAGQLPLPYKYRHLIEIFKAVDSVCAMFHNRKECITFKKLKPAVQRMLRKNFTEKHLAQIKQIYPEAFLFMQMKMRNYGSTSKADYFQLVITPNVENLTEKQKVTKIDEEDVLDAAQSKTMNPHIMTKRLQHFQDLLLQRVKDEHDKFLKSLDPPLFISKEKVMRWHPDFDLENCNEIELAHIPQPPNVEKYSSARDILSTARNLFNCATPMERAMERYEAKIATERKTSTSNLGCEPLTATNSKTLTTESPKKETNAIISNTVSTSEITSKVPVTSITTNPTMGPSSSATDTLLKGLPKSLVEKIRAKQAAKALDAMTRRPSQDQEATKYSRLPELARHLRNVFITERKGVLTLEIVIKKIENSFRTSLTHQEIEDHLRLMAKVVPTWVAFHEVRKTLYLKINKDMDLNKVTKQLEAAANEKSK